MSPFATSVRGTLFVQAAVTALFTLLRPDAGSGWTVATMVVAAAAVALGAALQPTSTMRTAVLGLEVVAVLFGVLSFAGGHYVPGTIIGIGLLIRLANTPAVHFLGAPQAAPVDSGFGAPQPASGPWAAPEAAVAGAPSAAPAVSPFAAPPAPAFPAAPASPWAAPDASATVSGPAAGLPQAAQPAQVVAVPVLPQQAHGMHPGGRTVLPEPVLPAAAAPVLPDPEPVVAAAPVAAAPVALRAAPEPAPVTAAPAPVAVAVAPVPAPPAPAPEMVLPVPEPPTTAVACVTILPA